MGNKVVPVVKSDRADAAVDNLKYTVVEGKNLIERIQTLHQTVYGQQRIPEL